MHKARVTAARAPGPGTAAELPSTIDRSQLIWLARTVLKQRQERGRVLPPEMFGEAAWDMLLELYSRGADCAATIAELAAISGGPASTAKRWVDYLEEQRLVGHQTQEGLDRIRLTENAMRTLDRYFCQLFTGTIRK